MSKTDAAYAFLTFPWRHWKVRHIQNSEHGAVCYLW